ncbi:hypothetical protein KEM54_001379 [Ascosphaera aggregata]|nr:hypothetical protein KEM54_001379 [Ascosphaera aggregata]
MMNTAISQMQPAPPRSNGTSRSTSRHTSASSSIPASAATARHTNQPRNTLGPELANLILPDSDSDLDSLETSSLSIPPQNARTPPPFLSPIPLRFEERAKRKLAGVLSSDVDEDSDIMDESDEDIRDLLRRTKGGGRKSKSGKVLGVVSPVARKMRKELNISTLSRNQTSSSFSHGFSASTRTLRNGEVVVTNSDPESDDEGVSTLSNKSSHEDEDDHDHDGGGDGNYDDDNDDDNDNESDIENPDEIFTRVLKSTSARTQDSPMNSNDEKPSRSSKRVKLTEQTNTTMLAASLDELLRDSERDKEITEKVASTNASISRYTLDQDNNYVINAEDIDQSDSGAEGKSCERKVSLAIHGRRLTEEIISATINDADEERSWKAQRLSRAFDRTEVFSQGKVWLFFSENAPSLAPPEFPNIQEKAWCACLKGRNRD